MGLTAERKTAVRSLVVGRGAELKDAQLQLVAESIVAGAAFSLASEARDQLNIAVGAARLESAGDFRSPTKHAVAFVLLMKLALVATKYQRSAFHPTVESGACGPSSSFRRPKPIGSALG